MSLKDLQREVNQKNHVLQSKHKYNTKGAADEDSLYLIDNSSFYSLTYCYLSLLQAHYLSLKKIFLKILQRLPTSLLLNYLK